MKTLERLNAVDAAEVYGVPNWSSGYFKVGKKGFLEATPHGNAKGAPLLKIIDDIVARFESLPVILRFPQILHSRIEQLNQIGRAHV